MSQLFILIASEEIPARMQKGAGTDLSRLMMAALEDAGLAPSGPTSYYGPRHIALCVDTIKAAQEDRDIEKRGPRPDAPEKAIAGFCQSVGMSRDQLIEEATDKGVFLFARQTQKGQPATALLPDILNGILAQFPWPKSQRWGTSRTSWVRPMHGIIMMLDGALVEGRFDLGGDMMIPYSRTAYGHGFHSPDGFEIASVSDWKDKSKAGFVMVDAAEKAAEISSQITQKTASLGIEAIADDGLLAEVTGLVEWPNVVVGQIADEFMALPEEVLITSMKVHQKYFATRYVAGKNAGKIAPYFITIANRQSAEATDQLIKQGNERVLRARLADAAFFYDQDRAKALADYVPMLDQVTFYEGLGSVGEKATRITALAKQIASYIDGADDNIASQAAHLAKADLVTDMVGEFPELQGLMGGYYARHHGAGEEVVQAIADHYKPAGPSDTLPRTPAGLAVSLADKIDTLVGFFGIGAKPTGSKDPFALRRASLSIIRMIDECDLALPLHDLCDFAARAYGFAAADKDISSFVRDRLTVMLRDSGVPHDVVAASLSGAGIENPRLMIRKARRLATALDGQSGAQLLAGFKRANNILAAEAKKDPDGSGLIGSRAIDETCFIETQETQLFNAVSSLPEAPVESDDDIEIMIAALSKLAEPIDAFFEAIIVNHDDPKVRANRLSLLALITQQMGKVADFSKIEK